MSLPLKPEIIVFAGPNGSGKSTIAKMIKIIEPYVNADEIKKFNQCSDLEAAEQADRMRENLLSENRSFTFETVMSTDRNLKLLTKAKDKGYFIRTIYVLTSNPQINISRIDMRASRGDHNVPEDKVISRYNRALTLIPDLVEISDICHIYDNSDVPFRIFKKRKDQYFYWENQFWDKVKIEALTGHLF